MSRAVLTHKEKEKMLELGKANEKLGWFFVEQPFKCKLVTLRRGWWRKTGTSTPEDGKKSVCDVKHKITNEFKIISYVDYLKIIDTFGEKNKHLI